MITNDDVKKVIELVKPIIESNKTESTLNLKSFLQDLVNSDYRAAYSEDYSAGQKEGYSEGYDEGYEIGELEGREL